MKVQTYSVIQTSLKIVVEEYPGLTLTGKDGKVFKLSKVNRVQHIAYTQSILGAH